MASRTFPVWLWVGIGAMLGGLLRHGAGALAGWPWPTLAVNVLGSFAIGLYWALTGPDGRLLVAPRYRFAMMAGFCGGLTTFSMFALEFWLLLASGARGQAGLYLLASPVLWLAAAAAGIVAGKWINGVGK